MTDGLKKMSALKAMVGDRIYDLESLYRNIHEKAIQEAVDQLLQLLAWFLWIEGREGACCGGCGNLLLDVWWLEFWEIILLTAGDMERNPGPRRITGKSTRNT